MLGRYMIFCAAHVVLALTLIFYCPSCWAPSVGRWACAYVGDEVPQLKITHSQQSAHTFLKEPTHRNT
jgi:hypothetical protein